MALQSLPSVQLVSAVIWTGALPTGLSCSHFSKLNGWPKVPGVSVFGGGVWLSVPRQTPPVQTSFVVRGSLSSHDVLSATTVVSHAPDVGLHAAVRHFP